MKRSLLAGIGLCALAMAAQPAVAADMPARIAKAPAMVAAPLFNWSGFYWGGQAGYLWGDADLRVNSSVDYNVDGFLGGLHAGFNWHAGSLVWGFETDINWSGADGDDGAFGGDRDETEIRWTGSSRLRVGIPANNWLFYATGGLAYADIRQNIVNDNESDSTTRLGWTVGAGAEIAYAPNATARIEYRYTDYGDMNFDYPTNNDRRLDLTTHQVMVGLSWKFASGKMPVGKAPAAAPAVVTKY